MSQLCLEDVGHSFIDIEFHDLISLIKSLIQPNEVAQKNLFCATLNQGWGKACRELTVDLLQKSFMVLLKVMLFKSMLIAQIKNTGKSKVGDRQIS